MEGFMDVIAAYRAGIENAVASMGTALSKGMLITSDALPKKLFSAMMVIRQGKAATAKGSRGIKRLLSGGCSVPDAMDPDEYLQKILLKTWLTFYQDSD